MVSLHIAGGISVQSIHHITIRVQIIKNWVCILKREKEKRVYFIYIFKTNDQEFKKLKKQFSENLTNPPKRRIKKWI